MRVYERAATYTHVGVNYSPEACVGQGVCVRMCGFKHTNFGVNCSPWKGL